MWHSNVLVRRSPPSFLSISLTWLMSYLTRDWHNFFWRNIVFVWCIFCRQCQIVVRILLCSVIYLYVCHQGTSAEQDNRFSNKQKKLLKQLKFAECLDKKVNHCYLILSLTNLYVVLLMLFKLFNVVQSGPNVFGQRQSSIFSLYIIHIHLYT